MGGLPVALPRDVRAVFDDLHEQMDEVQPRLSKSIAISIGAEIHLRLDPAAQPLRFVSSERGADARITSPDVPAFLRAVERVRGASVGFVVRILFWKHPDISIHGKWALVKALWEARRSAAQPSQASEGAQEVTNADAEAQPAAPA